MNKATKTVLVVALLVAVLLLSGCNLSASKAPAVQPSATSEMLFMTDTPAGEGLAGGIATQTAEAGKPAVATETPAPTEAPAAVEPTATTAQQQAAAQEEQKSVSVPTLTRPDSYTLQKGEWPICIARRYDLNIGDLFSANGLTMSSKPGAGTTLKIPSSGNWSEANYGARALRAHSDYTVKSGDSLYTIACYYGDVSPEAIMAVNGLSSADDIKVGMTLDIP